MIIPKKKREEKEKEYRLDDAWHGFCIFKTITRRVERMRVIN